MAARRISVLIVEDEVLISNLVTEALSDVGFDVHAVPDGEEALRCLKADPNIDVLFTDINLAGRMDGSALAEQARRHRPELPIVYCSGRCSPSAVSPVPRSIFVKKPYDIDDICTLLTRLTSTTH
ncbi:MAG: response regulator [Pseudolabrys sp.]|nr:response regulator [Pseudolabrys sp.]